MKCLLSGLRPFITFAVSFTIIITAVLIYQIKNGYEEVPFPGKIISESKTCSDIGMDMMKGNVGNAVDAVLSTVFCLSVTCPHYLSLLGGGFMIIHSHKIPQKTLGLEFWPRTPKLGIPSAVKDFTVYAGIPGLVKGLERAHEIFGKASWVDIIKPSIILARTGYHPIPSLIKSIDKAVNESTLSKSLYDMLLENEILPDANTTLVNVALARCLENLALNGSKEFYEGIIGQSIVSQLQSRGSLINLEDFSRYNVTDSNLVKIGIGSSVFYTIGSPSSGGSAMSIIKALAQVNQNYRTHTSLEELVDIVKKYVPKFGNSHSNGVTVIGTDSEEMDVVFAGGLGSLFGSGFMTAEGLIVNDALKEMNNQLEPFASLVIMMGADKEICGRRIMIGGTDLGYTMSKSLPIMFTNSSSSLRNSSLFTFNSDGVMVIPQSKYFNKSPNFSNIEDIKYDGGFFNVGVLWKSNDIIEEDFENSF